MTSRPHNVDFHCHLDLYPDLRSAIDICETAKTATLAVTTTPKAFRHNLRTAKGSEFVRVGLGLHPHLAAERRAELPLFEGLLPETRYVGEVGLDAGPRFYQSMPEQTDVFRRILRMCAEQGGKILSVHSVRTAGKVLDHVEELLPPGNGKVVLHWFSGTLAEARRASALGCYFSVNQMMLAKENGRKLVAALPMDRILTETDGPFIDDGADPIGPGNVAGAVLALSQLTGIAENDMRRKLVKNFASMIGREAS